MDQQSRARKLLLTLEIFLLKRVLEKAGFVKEGLLRKRAFIRGDWRDLFIYSILREEWKEPKILTRTEKK